MTPWKTSEIARRLAERDDVEPPEGLLEKLKRDIPPELPALPLAPEVVPQIAPETLGRPRPSRHRVWLMAASLAAAVLGGVLALRVMQTMPAQEADLKKAAQEQQPARAVSPVAPKPAPLLPPPPPPPAFRREALRAGESQGTALGELSSKKEVQPAQVPEALPASPAPVSAPPPAPAKTAAPREERASAQAESPVAGVAGRRVSTGATVSEEELKKIPTARDPWSVLQAKPGVKTDRINVGGNESGQQSSYAGPGTAAAPEPPPVSTDAAAAPLLDQRQSAKSTHRLDVDPEELVHRFSSGGEPSKDRAAAVRAEGVPVPGAAGGDLILRFLAGDAEARVDFNPEAVSSWRRLGSTLYEVKLKPEATASQTIATLHLPDTTRDLRVADLAPTWDTASPGLRLAALAAELADVLRGSSRAKDVDLNDLVRRAKKVAADLAGTPREQDAADFVRLAEEAARGRRSPHGDR
jgi:hypothetical protein